MSGAKGAYVALADLLATVAPGGSYNTWDAEERDIWQRACLCCGERGHYQRALEAHLAEHGLTEGVCIGADGRLQDGHHRVIAARHLGIQRIPLETPEQAGERWQRDHPVPAGAPCEDWKRWHWRLVEGRAGFETTSAAATGSATVALVLAVCIAGGLLLLGLLAAGQSVMCAAHSDGLRYCEGYPATTEREAQR